MKKVEINAEMAKSLVAANIDHVRSKFNFDTSKSGAGLSSDDFEKLAKFNPVTDFMKVGMLKNQTKRIGDGIIESITARQEGMDLESFSNLIGLFALITGVDNGVGDIVKFLNSPNPHDFIMSHIRKVAPTFDDTLTSLEMVLKQMN